MNGMDYSRYGRRLASQLIHACGSERRLPFTGFIGRTQQSVQVGGFTPFGDNDVSPEIFQCGTAFSRMFS